MQKDRSHQTNKSQTASLVIAKKGKEQLTKSQQDFNKLAQKIERLQKDIQAKQGQLDLALKIYATEYSSAITEIALKLYNLILLLFNVYKSKKLSDSNQRQLKKVLEDYVDNYLNICDGEPDTEIQAVISRLEGMTYAKVMERKKEQEMEELREMFTMVNVDVEGVDLNDPAILIEKVKEANEKAGQHEDDYDDESEQKRRKASGKKLSAKQLNYEKQQQAVQEAKQKNISTIYRQLAKLFHPDLEQDVELKAEKELLMKQLTTAYENKDLHALLMLELKWIHKETDHLHTLTEEKLAVYLQVLRDQVKDLQAEKESLIEHPQYAVLVNQFGYELTASPVAIVKDGVKDAVDEIKMLEKDVRLFSQPDALKHVNNMLKSRKQQSKNSISEDDMLQLFFDMMK